MEIDSILNDLAFCEGLPTKALRAAGANRQAMVPIFLDEIEQYLASDADQHLETTSLFFMFHLLGSWRERSAYRPLARMLRRPSDEINHILGDATTTTSHRVMAAVFDGDPGPIYDVIRDARADEFIRARMCEAVAIIALNGELPREEAQRFLIACHSDLKPRRECFVWDGWQSAIAMLGLSDLKPLVERAFKLGYISPSWLRFEHFEADLQRGIDEPGTPRRRADDEYTLFGDTIDELAPWYGFSEKSAEDRKPKGYAAPERSTPVMSAASRTKSVGRNDACPCGSGRKLKNCCLTELQEHGRQR